MQTKIAIVNMAKIETSFQSVHKEDFFLGGRGLTSSILARETKPDCEPLGPENKVVIAPGLLSGTSAPSSGRLSLGAKSPLTGGIKESNVGGTVGRAMARLGIKAVQIEGQPQPGHLFLIEITEDGAYIHPSDNLRGASNYEVGRYLSEKYGSETPYLCIGQGGEGHLPLATVAASDMEGRPTRHAGRGGIGGVLGSKGIKAIVVLGKGETVRPSDSRTFLKTQKILAKELIQTKKALKNFGSAVLVDLINEAGALPVQNFRFGSSEKATQISGHVLAENCKARGGRTGHGCLPGCVIKCSNIYNDPNGQYLTSALEYETIVLLGINCGLTDLDCIAELDFMCDDYGIDTMETGAALCVAMEAGIIKFGDFLGMKKLIQEIVENKGTGKMLKLGAYKAGEMLGIKRVPVVKKQAISAYDPRALKGTGVTYATSPMGADHTAGNCIPGRTGLDDTESDGQIEASKELQILTVLFDILGLCLFVGPEKSNLSILTKLFNTFTGQNYSENKLLRLAEDIIQKEVFYNKKAGLTSETNDVPEFFRKEPLPPLNLVFDVKKEDLKNIVFSM